jgi:hypothetical protein
MQIPAANSLPDYGVLAIIVVSLLGVVFLIWFLIALILDVRKTHPKRLVFHQQQQRARFAHPAHRRSAEIFEMEVEHARHSLDGCDDRFFRDLDRVRPLLRSRKVIRDQ